jgi:hypothetical protein
MGIDRSYRKIETDAIERGALLWLCVVQCATRNHHSIVHPTSKESVIHIFPI